MCQCMCVFMLTAARPSRRAERARASAVFMTTSFAMTPIKYLLYDVDPNEV